MRTYINSRAMAMTLALASMDEERKPRAPAPAVGYGVPARRTRPIGEPAADVFPPLAHRPIRARSSGR